jgi:capsular polysaccharide transport system ATP-binding protein
VILVDDVHKRYSTAHGAGDWILRGITLTIPQNRSVAFIGRNGAGKSTLLRIIAGTDYPTKGRIQRLCRVSWPMANAGLKGSLSGRSNAKFVCRIHGHQSDLGDRIAFIQDFSELGPAFEEPVMTYSSGMKARLQFALSLAFNFDVYISDEITGAGDAKFREKTREAFKTMADSASVIMVSHDEGTLRQFCESGVLVENGQAHWFEDLEDALTAYKNSFNS